MVCVVEELEEGPAPPRPEAPPAPSCSSPAAASSSSSPPAAADATATATATTTQQQAPDAAAQPAESSAGGSGTDPPALSEEQQASMLAAAEALKAEGNALYAQQDYAAAAEKYADAIEAAPPPPLASKQRAVYLANLAACDIGRGDHAEALRACTAAIEEDPTYIKAYARRFNAYEALDELDRALEDAKKVLELDPGNTWASVSARRLEPIVKARHEKLKDEMMSKFKDLGNTLLGKFGMSLDNFKAEKDPATGGYSIKFQQ